MNGVTDYVHRDGMRRRDRWLAQPGPIIYKTGMDKASDVLLGVLMIGTLATATAFAVMILQGL